MTEPVMQLLAQSGVQSVDWAAVAPPTITAIVGLAVLVTDLFLPAARTPLLGRATVLGLLLAGLSLLPLLDGTRSTFCPTDEAGSCSYTVDHFTLIIQLLVLGGALLTALLSLHGPDGPPAGEFWFLLLSSTAGAVLLPAARDLATLIVALEVTSLPAFALVGTGRGARLAGEAALKFFLSSVVATAITLLGVSFVYAVTGTLHLTTLATALAHTPAQFAVLARTGVALTLIGFAFKLAVAPFHFWVPDTYTGAPLPVAAYLSVVGKTAGFAGLILLTALAFPSYAHEWGPVLAVLAALTMTVGNTAALRQPTDRPRSAVRLLAWSSVAQAGYLLVPLAAAGYATNPDRRIGTTVAYALMYAVVNLGAFGVVVLVGRARALGRITDFRGLYAAHPFAALALAFFLLSLAGLPPGIIGLFAKALVFSSALHAGLGWLAVVMAANVVTALFYYVRWTALLFTPAAEPGDAPAAPAGVPLGRGEPATSGVPLPLGLAIGLTAVAGIALSGAPQLILRFASGALL